MEYQDYRNIELSIYAAFEESMPDSVNLTTEEPEEHMETPTVGVYNLSLNYRPFEMGNEADQDVLYWGTAIFANTTQQRDYLMLFVYNKLKNWSIPMYDYSQDPATTVGNIYFEDPSAEPVRAPQDTTDKLLYHALVTFKVTYSQEE